MTAIVIWCLCLMELLKEINLAKMRLESLVVYLVVGFSFHPVSSRKTTEQCFPDLIIDKDESREWKGWQPPPELERVHSETLVHSRSVGKEGSQSSLKENTKIQDPVIHALLEDRELASFANDQVSPLDNDNGDKEGSVASVLENFSVPVGPFLAIGIFQVIDSNRIPGFTETKQAAWPESVLSQDDKVGEEASRSLNHTNLTISHGDQTFIDQLVSERIPRLSLHDVRFRSFISHGDSRNHVSTQINAKNGDSTKGKRHISNDKKQKR